MRLKNFPFRIESELFKLWYRVLRARPSSQPFVSGDSFRSISDHIVEPGAGIDPRSIESENVVFVQSSEIGHFVGSILPKIKNPFVLITHNGDLNIDKRFSALANHDRLIHWFAQNALFRHPKVTALPIGLENRFLHSNGVLGDFKRLACRHSNKSNRILYGFTVENNVEERRPAEEALRLSPLADFTSRLNGRKYREVLEYYGFVASPPGNGVDCHRTWEAFYLGVIPIVKKSVFYDFFPGLPALFLDDWKEIIPWDDQFLARTRDILTPQIESLQYLRFDYWAGLIDQARNYRFAGQK